VVGRGTSRQGLEQGGLSTQRQSDDTDSHGTLLTQNAAECKEKDLGTHPLYRFQRTNLWNFTLRTILEFGNCLRIGTMIEGVNGSNSLL
jgi:hypothetical protein